MVVFLALISCQKDTAETIVPLTGSEVLGTWQLKATYISPGGETEWKDVVNGDISKFMVDSTFSHKNTLEGESDKSRTYDLNEGLRTLVYQEHDEEKVQGFLVKMDSNTMTLSSAGPIFCSEPCLSRYHKID